MRFVIDLMHIICNTYTHKIICDLFDMKLLRSSDVTHVNDLHIFGGLMLKENTVLIKQNTGISQLLLEDTSEI